MQNKEGIFSFNELLKLKDFCNNCAKEDKKIHEKRKVNPSYVPEDKKPEPIKKMKAPSYQVSNNNNNIQNNTKNIKNVNNAKNVKNIKNVNNVNKSNKISLNDFNKINPDDIITKQVYGVNVDVFFRKKTNNVKKSSDAFKNKIKMFEPKK